MVTRIDGAKNFDNHDRSDPTVSANRYAGEITLPVETLAGRAAVDSADPTTDKPPSGLSKTTLSAIALATLPLLAIGGMIYANANQSITQQISESSQQSTQGIASGLAQFMAERRNDIQALSSLPMLTNSPLPGGTSVAAQQTMLKQLLATYQVYDNIAVFNVNGGPILQTGQGSLPNQKNNQSFQQALQAKEPVVTQPIQGSDGTAKIYLLAPVRRANSQTVIGVVRASLPVSVLESRLQASGNQTDQYQVFDATGKFFIAEPVESLGQLARTNFPQLEWSRATGSTAVIKDPLSQQPSLVSYAPILPREGLPDLKWGVVAKTDASTAFASQQALLLQFLIGGGLAVVLAGTIAALLTNRATRSLLKTTQMLQQVSAGKLDSRLVVQGNDEFALVGNAINQLVAQMQLLQMEQSETVNRDHLVAEITSNIRQTLDFDTILRTSVEGMRQVLNVDRTVIYRFSPDFKSGEITAESVRGNWARALGQTIHDPLMPDSVARYQRGQVTMVENLETADLTRCHCEILERLEVKANIVAPILVNEELVGLICAHQCSGPRHWQPSELDLVQQLSAQIGYALSQAASLKLQSDTALRERQQAAIVSQMRQVLDEASILQVTVQQTREALSSDRVLVYMFDPQWSGKIVAESVDYKFPPAFGIEINDPCFAKGYIDKYKNGAVQATDNIQQAGLTECHLNQLKPLGVQANLVAPILVNDQLKGLFVAHQCTAPRVWSVLDINLMRQVAGQLGFALEQAALLEKERLGIQQAYLAQEIMLSMRKSLKREDIFETTVEKLRYALQADRVVIYQFNPDWTGTIIAESVASGWRKILNEVVDDPFREGLIEEYRNGRVRSMDNVAAEEIAACHRDILDGFEIRASIVAPLLRQGNLLGLISVHQCAAARYWQPSEINLVSQLAIQLTFALEQAELFEGREQAQQQAELISQEQRRQRETLQMQLIDLLSDVEGVAHGDLTVRADVTAGDIGTVADFFNSIVESLRDIVTQVKLSAKQVNLSLGENEGAMRHLAEEALQQAEETTHTLASVEQMTRSIQAVAVSAQQAATVARQASTTAQVGEDAIARTVQNILSLRETVGETTKKVKRLGESSQQISKVVSLINQIAMQTNLLAINAGIEAARAGEEGQGFAVVAEEVGELAARSAAATQEIEKIVENIQRETSQVVEAMEQSTVQVVEGTHLVDDAKQSLHQILNVSHQIDELVQSISDATVSQVETSESVSRLMKQIAQVSERTSDSSRQVSSSLRKTVAVAQELQESVETFKVDSDG